MLFPPLAVLVIGGLLALLLGGRRRAGEKYAGPAHPAMSAGGAKPKKLVLTVIDAMKPAMLERAVATGRAPALKLLIEHGALVDDCVAAFPSVTPVCAASIATGVGPDAHDIPSMNWYHRGEGRYVEYGTSFKASQTFGFKRSLTDTIYNMNLEHLSKDVKTVFESLDDADVRTAGTTYLMYRGRHRHEVTNDTALTRLASTVFRHAVYGPREFFYADIFASRKTGCRAPARPAGPARPARRLRRRAPRRERPVRLPAAVAARQRHALAQATGRSRRCPRSPRPTSRSSA